MSMWQILGLAETHDKRSIKKAYARQLKLIDQEQNPEAFIALREALEQALHYAEYYQEDWQDNTFEADATPPTLTEKLQYIQHDGLHIQVIESSESNHVPQNHIIYDENVTTSTDLNQQDITQELKQKIEYDVTENIEPKNQDLIPDSTQEFKNSPDNIINTEDYHIQNPLLREWLEQSSVIFDGQTELEQHYPIYYHHHQPLIFQLINQSLHYLHTEQFHHESFIYFQECLAFIKQQPLIEQIELKNYFSAYLSAVYSATTQPNFARFVLYWQEQFPDPEQFFIDNDNAPLYQYIDFFKQQDEILHSLNEKTQHYLNKVIYNQRFNLWSMLYLLFKPKVTKNLAHFAISEPNQNKNYFFLYNIQQWHRELWIYIIVFMSGWLFLKELEFYYSTLNPRNIFAISIGFFLVYYVLHFIFKSKILTSEYLHTLRIQNYLKYIWFFTGIIFSLSFSYLWYSYKIATMSMCLAWLLFTTFIFSLAQYHDEDKLHKKLFKSVNIYIDYLVIIASIFIVLLYAFIPYVYYEIKIPQWLYVFGFIPIGFLFFSQYFSSLYKQLSYHKHDDDIEHGQFKYKLKFHLQDQSMIIARAGLVFAFSYIISNTAILVNFYTTILLFLSILIVAYRDYISYVLKYLTIIIYFICLILFSSISSSWLVTIVFTFLFSKTLYHDWKKLRH